ncbi:unnamed protein product, partial [Allacma fusca]
GKEGEPNVESGIILLLTLFTLL